MKKLIVVIFLLICYSANSLTFSIALRIGDEKATLVVPTIVTNYSATQLPNNHDIGAMSAGIIVLTGLAILTTGICLGYCLPNLYSQ